MVHPADLPLDFADLAEARRFGVGLGLHRALDLFQAAAWPDGLEAIKITGSNGKGSTCAFLTSILRRLGVACGTYLSPHFDDLAERFLLDGEPAPNRLLDDAWARARRTATAFLDRHPDDGFGGFELLTGTAFELFAAELSTKHPAVVIAEAGIGGRYDTTRVLPGGLAALTSVDLEHTDLLGSTREQIAFDKADLCPEGGTLVVGALDTQPAETTSEATSETGLLERLDAYTRLRGVELVEATRCCRVGRAGWRDGRFRADLELALDGSPAIPLEGVELGLGGAHQTANAAVAVVLAARWARRGLPDLALDRSAAKTSAAKTSAAKTFADAVRVGLAEARLAGRFERVAVAPEVRLDACHTPAAARDAFAGRRTVLVVGVSGDKQVEEIVAHLAPIADAAVCARARKHGASTDRIQAAWHAARTDLEIERIDEVGAAIERARDLATPSGAVLIAGGLFLAAEARRMLRSRQI